MIKNNFKIFISATEQSGDNIGYNLIKEILRTNDKITFEDFLNKNTNFNTNIHQYIIKNKLYQYYICHHIPFKNVLYQKSP